VFSSIIFYLETHLSDTDDSGLTARAAKIDQSLSRQYRTSEPYDLRLTAIGAALEIVAGSQKYPRSPIFLGVFLVF